jgi:hypothetical protein
MAHRTRHQFCRFAFAMRIICLILAVGFVLSACSSTEDKLITAFMESNPVASEEDAQCVVDKLVEVYRADGVADELEAEAPSAGFLNDQGMAMSSCGVVVNTKADLVSAFTEANPEVSKSEATCVIDVLTTDLGTAQLIANLWAEPVPRDFELAQFRAMFDCGIDDDVRAALEVQLAEQGTPSDKAPCVADAIVDKMTSDELDVLITGENNDEFYAKYFSAMESCGALNS